MEKSTQTMSPGTPSSSGSKGMTSSAYTLEPAVHRLEQTKGALEPRAAMAPGFHSPAPEALHLPPRQNCSDRGSLLPGQGEATCGITPDHCFCVGAGSRGGADSQQRTSEPAGRGLGLGGPAEPLTPERGTQNQATRGSMSYRRSSSVRNALGRQPVS